MTDIRTLYGETPQPLTNLTYLESLRLLFVDYSRKKEWRISVYSFSILKPVITASDYIKLENKMKRSNKKIVSTYSFNGTVKYELEKERNTRH